MDYELLKAILDSTDRVLRRMPIRSVAFTMNDCPPEFNGELQDGRWFMIRWDWDGVCRVFWVKDGDELDQWRIESESISEFVDRILSARNPEPSPEKASWHDRLGSV